MATRRRICRIRVLAKNLPFFGEFEYSPVLSNSSTRQNGHFGKLAGLDTFADIRQTILLGLARLAKGKIGNFYTNLANLASLVNLASVD